MTRRIAILYTGGTLGMKPSASGYQPDTGLTQSLAACLPAPGEGRMPYWEVHEYAQLIDSAEAQPRDWHMVAADIATRYDDFDGFVVVHGTDTMAYTAAALSFALRGLRKPVILTGSQIPLCEPRSDALGNLLGALLIAAHHPVAEVCLYFGGKLLRGNRATKVAGADFDAFDSPNYPLLGRAGIDIVVDTARVLAVPVREAFEIVPPAACEIAVLRVYPGLSVVRLERMLEPPLAGVVLQTYGAGNGPVRLPGFLDTLAGASARSVVIVNVTQCARGTVDQGKYATGSALAAAGVLGAYDMTIEAALTKLHHLFALELSPHDVRRRMQQAVCGECTVPGDLVG